MVDIYKAPEAQLTKPAADGDYGSLEDAVSGNYQFRIKKVLAEAWGLVRGAKLAFFLAGLMYFVIYIVAVVSISTILTALGITLPDLVTGEYPVGVSPLLVFFGQIVNGALMALLLTPLWVGFQVMGITRSGANKVLASSIFSKYHKMLPLFFTSILMYLMIAIGFLLLVLPGIYLAFSYAMAFPLVTEKNLGPWEALETSRRTISKKWFRFFGFGLLAIILILIAALPLGIGLIWVMPLIMISFGVIYRNMFGL